jgi:hypothetical protein
MKTLYTPVNPNATIHPTETFPKTVTRPSILVVETEWVETEWVETKWVETEWVETK